MSDCILGVGLNSLPVLRHRFFVLRIRLIRFPECSEPVAQIDVSKGIFRIDDNASPKLEQCVFVVTAQRYVLNRQIAVRDRQSSIQGDGFFVFGNCLLQVALARKYGTKIRMRHS